MGTKNVYLSLGFWRVPKTVPLTQTEIFVGCECLIGTSLRLKKARVKLPIFGTDKELSGMSDVIICENIIIESRVVTSENILKHKIFNPGLK